MTKNEKDEAIKDIEKWSKEEPVAFVNGHHIAGLSLRIEELEKKIDERFKGHARAVGECGKILNELGSEIDELKELLKHSIHENTCITLMEEVREVLREFFNKFNERYGYFSWIQELLDKLDGNSVDYKKKYEDCVESKVSISKVPKHWVTDIFPELNDGDSKPKSENGYDDLEMYGNDGDSIMGLKGWEQLNELDKQAKEIEEIKNEV